jgi:hypothetical protein
MATEPYCNAADLYIAEDMVAPPAVKQQFIKVALDDIDSKLGFIYVTPIDVGSLPSHQAKLLKTMAAKLASGRLIMANALGQENSSVHAYAAYLCREAEMELMNIANGVIDLTAPRVDATGAETGLIPDPSIDDPYARIPTSWNPDQTSAVTTFERNFHTETAGRKFLWSPDENIDDEGRIIKVI